MRLFLRHQSLLPPSGCWLEGRRVLEGETVASRADPCVSCTCSGDRLTCQKRACPVLSCPPTRRVMTPGSCCMTCQGELLQPLLILMSSFLAFFSLVFHFFFSDFFPVPFANCDLFLLAFGLFLLAFFMFFFFSSFLNCDLFLLFSAFFL